MTPVYGGGPQTFLILGSDRRSGSKNTLEKTAAPRSDTILLVRFDPSQGQTSVISIPRDLMVNIRTPKGQLYPDSKINAAYTIGGTGHGNDGGSVLAAETIEREVFPELKGQLNGIIDVNFQGFIKVVDALGCAYVNVDHRYLGGGARGENFSAINLQPGYQKLCYNNALSYVRFRHYDSDLVRVARQQDFLRSLREQVSPEIGSIDRIAKAVGHAIRTNFHASAERLIELSKLIAFSQTKPLRQVKFRYSNANFMGPGGESFVTSTPQLEKETLADFLHGTERVHLPPSHSAEHRQGPPPHSSSSSSTGAAAAAKINLVPTTGESEMVSAALHIPFKFLYPTLQTGLGQAARSAPLRASQLPEKDPLRLRGRLADEHDRRLLRLRGHRLDEPAPVQPLPHLDDRRAGLQTGQRRGPHPRDRLEVRQGPLLGDEHAARGTLELADDRDRQISPDAALASGERRRN